MSKSNLKHLEHVKDNIKKSNTLSEEEKSSSYKHIEEWYIEDQSFGTLMADLSKISPQIRAILSELGLV